MAVGSEHPLLLRPSSVPRRPRRDILALKLWFMFYFGSQYTQTFLPLILQQLMHFSPSTIGMLMSLRRLTISIAAPSFAFVCDLTALHRHLLVLTLSLYYLCTMLLTRVRRLLGVSTVLFLRDAFVAGVEPTVNTAVLAKLSDPHLLASSLTFGSLRLWGSLGWGLISFLAPTICALLFTDVSVPMLLSQVCLGLPVVLLPAFILDFSPHLFQSTHAPPPPSAASAATAAHPPVSTHAIVLCIVCLLQQGIVMGSVQTTFMLYLSSLQISESTSGLAILFASLAEAATYYGDEGIRAYQRSEAVLMRYAMGCNAAMLACFIALNSMHLVPLRLLVLLLSQLLSGCSLALFVGSAVSMTARVAPPKWRTGGQGLVQAVLFGMGPAIGALVSGVCMQIYGAPSLYAGLLVLDVIVLAIMQMELPESTAER